METRLNGIDTQGVLLGSDTQELPATPLQSMEANLDDFPEAYRFEYAMSMSTLEKKRSAQKLAQLSMKPVISPAYAELGGGLSTIEAAKEPWYNKYIDTYDSHQLEIRRAFEEFNIPNLTIDAVHAMTKDDQKRLGIHMHSFYKQLQNRINVFSTEGSVEDPRFAKYGFDSEDEARVYAGVLKNFRGDFLESEAWKSVQHINPDEKDTTRDVRLHKNLYPFVVYDTRDKKLRLHYEDASDFLLAA